MNILLTGGTGFIGGHVAQALTQAGHDVRLLRRGEAMPVLSRYQIVYHLAGVLGRDGVPYNDYYDAHVTLPQRFLAAMRPDQHFVYMSTQYLDQPQRTHAHYLSTKRLGEATTHWHPKTTIVRPSFIIGPGDHHHLPLYRWVKRLGWLYPIQGSGRQRVCPLYVGDVVKALMPENITPGLLRLAGEQVTMAGFLGSMAEALGVPRPRLHVPPFYKRGFLATDRPMVSDVPPTSLREALRITVDSYKEAGWL